MKKIFIIIASLILLGIFIFNITKPSDSETKVATLSEPEIAFFWLPSGLPCQEQDKILKEITAQEKYKNVKITHIDVTESANSSKMNKYGIRSVPNIIVLDKSQKVQKQFAPGIQSESILKNELDIALSK